jgi:hypothetical protein
LACLWAISALQLANYCELDCSFKALESYIYSIPLAVKSNVGIPLDIVIAAYERRDVFSIFADTFGKKDLSLQDPYGLPLLSDAGMALRS